MIPKIIHYCWFGKGEMSAELQKCVASWSVFLPDYKIMRWDETNLPANTPFLKLLFKYRKWALISDYIRFYALYQQGGIYFDTDIEVIKPFDTLLKEKCFIGFQQKSLIKHPLNGAVIGCEPRNKYLQDCLLLMTNSFYQKIKPMLGPLVVSEVAKKYGLCTYGEQKLNEIKILPSEVFYPYHWEEKFYPECIKENTRCIHRWQYSWKRKRDFKMLLKSAGYKIERSFFIFRYRLYLNTKQDS